MCASDGYIVFVDRLDLIGTLGGLSEQSGRGHEKGGKG